MGETERTPFHFHSALAQHLPQVNRSRLDDAQLLVLAGGGQQGAVAVERHGINDIRVTFGYVDGRAGHDVPHENQVIRAGAQEDVARDRDCG